MEEQENGKKQSSGDAERPREKSEKKRNLFGRMKEKIVGWKNFFEEEMKERTGMIAHARAKRIAAIVFLCVLVVFFIAFYFTVGKKIAFFIRDPEGFREWLNGFGKDSVVIFILLRIVQTVFKLIPGEALEIAAGCVFGVWEGLLWCLVGSLIGSLVVIFLGRRYGMRLVGLFVSPKRMQSVSFLKDKKRLNFVFFLLYFIPGTPKDMFTWLICLTDENIFFFLLLTTIARIPSIVVSTWCGHELVNENYFLSVAILAVTIALGVVGGIIFKVVNGRKRGVRETEAAENGENSGDDGEKEEKRD